MREIFWGYSQNGVIASSLIIETKTGAKITRRIAASVFGHELVFLGNVCRFMCTGVKNVTFSLHVLNYREM